MSSDDRPTALINLLDVLHQAVQSLAGLDRTCAVSALRAQADLIMAMTEESDFLEPGRARVCASYEQFIQERLSPT
ncbi:MAG: hypothetical protein PSX37_04740 [bacterium]|nr:hypothetical protein [bacterium]